MTSVIALLRQRSLFLIGGFRADAPTALPLTFNVARFSSEETRVDWRAKSMKRPTSREHKLLKFQKIRKRFRLLLDYEKTPRFKNKQYGKIKQSLETIVQEQATDEDMVNLTMRIIQRVVREQMRSNITKHFPWIKKPQFFFRIYELWKVAYLRGDDVMHPKQLLRSLQKMEKQLRVFHYNIKTVCLIMEAWVATLDPGRAPLEAEAILHFARAEYERTQCEHLRPNAYIYSLVLQAWCNSGLPDSLERMERLFKLMSSSGIVPTPMVFACFLRYWGERGDIAKVHSILNIMLERQMKIDNKVLSEAVKGMARVGKPVHAEELLTHMLEREPDNDSDLKYMEDSVQSIMISYAKILMNGKADITIKEKAVESAEILFDRVMNRGFIDPYLNDNSCEGLVDVYILGIKYNLFDSIFSRIKHDHVKLTLMVKALGEIDLAEKAQKIVDEMLESEDVDPTLTTFHELIHAWAKSSNVDAVENAYTVLEQMNHPKCKLLGISPNTETYNAVESFIPESRDEESLQRRAKVMLRRIERETPTWILKTRGALLDEAPTLLGASR